MRILVTGGAGFIGSHLVDALVDKGHAVRVLDLLEPQVHGKKKPAYLNPKAEYLWGDVRDRGGLRQALEGMEAVFHEAAQVGVGQSMYEIERYMSHNVLGTAVLLDVLANERLRPRKLVVASSMSLYGEGSYRCPVCGPVYPLTRPEEHLRRKQWEMPCPRCGKPALPSPTPEEKPLAPTSIYAISKRDQEESVLAVGRAYGIPSVALRYFNVYGTRQALSNPYTGVCAIFSARIKNDKPPLIFEDGLQSRDFVHVSDVARANLLVLENPRADYQTFNVGTGRPATVLDIARTLTKLYGKSVKPELPQKFRAGDIRHCIADISKIQALGYRPRVTLEEGLRDLAAWGQGVEAVDRVDRADRELQERGLTHG
ncbi:MAG: NAD-dependent epimerase/dehydratase family protein [Candidatus Omnitrophica bacterium]|nr:NAD-dependent epimerase/dehydratase family protein [Candidatus Omnitrophota bacterium]